MNLRFMIYDLRVPARRSERGLQPAATGNALGVPERIGCAIWSGQRTDFNVALRNTLTARSRTARNS
jgi:hypothetical protein